MIFDKVLEEAYRIGEKVVEAESMKPAGHVFAPRNFHGRPPGPVHRKARPGTYPRASKLSKLADTYRPKEQK